MKKKKSRVTFFLLFLWFLFVLYPNPVLLPVSILRMMDPSRALGALPVQEEGLTGKTAAEIEQLVYAWIPYEYDWVVYGMPWYFPSLDEVLKNQEGDCKARYILFASLLEQQGMAYETRVSVSHIWVDYGGKTSSSVENEDVTFLKTNDQGEISFQWPDVDWATNGRVFWEAFWQVMPWPRKVLLILGWPVIHVFLYGFRRASRLSLLKQKAEGS